MSDAGLPTSWPTRLWATILATGNPGALGVQTGAAFWGWCAWPDLVDVVVPRQRRVAAPPGARLWRLDLSVPGVARSHRIPVTCQAVTLAHCLRFAPASRAAEILDRSQQRGGPTLPQVLERLPRGAKGVSQARRLLAAADGTAFAAEKLAARLLREAAVGGWVANLEVRLRDRRYVIDFAFAELKIAVEIDGFAHHVNPDRFQQDRRKQNALMGDGWLVLRFTWADLTERPGDFVRLVRQAISARAVS